MVGRYQVMAVLQYLRFKKLNFKEKEARALSIFFATFYAICKNRAFSTLSQKNYKKSSLNSPFSYSSPKVLNIFNMKIQYEIRNKEIIYLLANQKITADKFKNVEIRFKDEEIFSEVLKEAKEYIDNFSPLILKNNNKFFNFVYKPARDEFTRKWREKLTKEG